MQKKNKSCLELNSAEAKIFFLEKKSYFSLNLPPYISFENLLQKIDENITNETFDFSKKEPKDLHPKDLDTLNHIIHNNKDGRYSWRPFTLIHPVCYVKLVQTITETHNWNFLVERFKFFAKNEKIKCYSLPLQSLTNKENTAEQIVYWWQEIEQASLGLAMDYDYLFHVDIADCYSSIYTHSIPWALHGKESAKKERFNEGLLGNKIDKAIQQFSHGQTNGIPQGSVLCDFIAEMVLGYADLELTKKIKKAKIENYEILRYRDDYRIFAINKEEGKFILKLLTEVLLDLSLKLNSSKTTETENLISGSIKPDKLYWILNQKKGLNLQEGLLLIHQLSAQFPNTGSLTKALTKYHKSIKKSKKIKENQRDLLPLISIVVDIAYKNPKVYPQAIAILSFLMNKLNHTTKDDLLNKIKTKFKKTPNTGYFELWLQRLELKTNLYNSFYEYNEPLCKMVSDFPQSQNELLWDCSWIKEEALLKVIKETSIIDEEKIENLPSVIEEIEVNIFSYSN